MKFGVIVFPGSNCEGDCYHVIKDVLEEKVEYIWHKDIRLDGFDCVILPGGFSYGDYLRTGAVARFSPVMNSVIDFSRKKPVVGICNGFQILLESGLLPGAMLRNTNIHFICKYVYVSVSNTDTAFTSKYKKGAVLRMPVAHNEGNYYIDEKGLQKLRKNRQIAFRYCGQNGSINSEFNPNGSIDNIAGIVNQEGTVLGMMPHPERCSESILGSEDGVPIFRSVIEWSKERR